MANIDVGALKKFHAQWGPLLEAIPAVLDLAEQRDDLQRQMSAQQAALDAAKKAIEDEYAAGEARINDIKTQADTLAARRKKLQADVEGAEKKLRETLDAVKKQAETDMAGITAAVAQARLNADAEIKKIKGEVDAIKAEKADALATAEAALKDAEDRKAKAEKALAALRAKLG